MIDANHIVETEKIMRQMTGYFQRLRSDPTTTIYMHEMLDRCRNEDANCAFWALVGECDKSPGFMKVSCAPVCHSCELLSRATRCPVDDYQMMQHIWKPGSVNEYFHNVTTAKEYQQFSPQIISKPTDTDKSKPWVVYIDKFLTDRECDRLINIAKTEGFSANPDNMGNAHDYTQTWLINDIIAGDRVVDRITKKIQKLTGIPQTNAENMQVIKVEAGQAQHMHHDYIYHQIERLPGLRILSVFLFLSDVEEGGELEFPKLDKLVEAKKGRAIIWPTVLDEDPDKREDNVFHRAREVKKGLRYTANVLHHQRDFKGPQQANCH